MYVYPRVMTTDVYTMRINSVQDVAAVAKGRRLKLGLSQGEVARRAGVSRPWISMFESAKPTTELGLVLRLLESLGLRMELGAEPEPEPEGAPASAGELIDLDELLNEYRKP